MKTTHQFKMTNKPFNPCQTTTKQFNQKKIKMKKLSEIKVNSSQLKLLIGENINFAFPTKMVITKLDKEVEKKLPETLANIIKQSDYAIKRSSDIRFDGRHPVILSTENIKEKGLRKSVIASIRGNYKCQKLKKIVGTYKFLIDLITDEHHNEILEILSKTHDAKLESNPKYYNK